MLKEDFTSKVEFAAHNVADTLLKNKSDYKQEAFEVAIKNFSKSINKFICTISSVSEQEKLLIKSGTILFDTIANKCPFLTERTDNDIVVVTIENQRKIVKTIIDSKLSMYEENVKDCLIHASISHTHKDDFFDSRKMTKVKNAQYFKNERLVFAAKHGNVDDLKILIKENANIHHRNERALVKASESGHIEIVKLLVENGADFKLNNFEALRLSTQNNHMETSTYLITLDREKSLEVLKNLTYISKEVIGDLMKTSFLYEENSKKSTLKN